MREQRGERGGFVGLEVDIVFRSVVSDSGENGEGFEL